MSEYVTVNCFESCPKCSHKIRMELMGIDTDDMIPLFELDCEYMKSIIINPNTMCNGMFEPKEAKV